MGSGSATTSEIAHDVLALRGNPAAAAEMVRTLLGGDPRFVAHEDGTWSLTDPLTPLAQPLRDLDYAVVDVETTGSLRWRTHGIVEIAVVHVSGGVITHRWHSLVDPGRRLPPFVTELTGITPEMVVGAPAFEHVASTVFGLLENRVFVAHNVGFDWGFVAAHLERTLGRAPTIPRLCTVHLARRLLPRIRSRTLDGLADHYRIPIHDRHRAAGDAAATARVLLRLLDAAELNGVHDLQELQRRTGRPARRPPRREAPAPRSGFGDSGGK